MSLSVIIAAAGEPAYLVGIGRLFAILDLPFMKYSGGSVQMGRLMSQGQPSGEPPLRLQRLVGSIATDILGATVFLEMTEPA